MLPEETQYNALMKIRSLIFNLTQENRITPLELDDYNAAAAEAFESLQEMKIKIKKAHESKAIAIKGMEKKIEDEKKLVAILEIVGMKPKGIKSLITYPLRFLTAIKNSVKNHQTPILNENYFIAIEQKYRWLNSMIERDKRNIKTISIQANLYKSKNEDVIKLSETIMLHIADESKHIIDGLREHKSFIQLQQQIEDHWYDQVAANNITE